MSTLDLVLALVVVAAAAGFLAWQLGLRKRAPACHPSRERKSARGDSGSNVVLDDRLARALAKAEARRATALDADRARAP